VLLLHFLPEVIMSGRSASSGRCSVLRGHFGGALAGFTLLGLAALPTQAAIAQRTGPQACGAFASPRRSFDRSETRAKESSMEYMNRRQALGRLAATGAGLVAANATGAAPIYAPAEAPSVPALRGQHQPKPLPFDPAKLKGLSEKLIRSHWENNYQGAVRALNSVEQRLDAMLKDNDLPPFVYGDLKREELVRTGSLVLHEYYFGNLGGDGKPGGDITNAIARGFGSRDQWEEEFKRTANGLAGGSGWVILAYNLHTAELHNYWAWDHMHNAPTGLPLLVLDMYEHAYQMDYGAAAGKYIDAAMQNINWEEVDRRYARAIAAEAALSG
jgi:superoxide dismutase, Fe-Mn family